MIPNVGNVRDSTKLKPSPAVSDRIIEGGTDTIRATPKHLIIITS